MKKAKLDGVIGIRAQDRRMGGTDESTELWGHLNQNCLLDYGTTFRWVSGHWTTFYIPGPILASLCLFLITIQFQIDKSVDIVLGNRTQGRRMVGADGTTELGWPPWSIFVFWQLGGLHYNLKSLLRVQWLCTPEICSLSPVIGKLYSLYWKVGINY